jgi:flavocytochrome c
MAQSQLISKSNVPGHWDETFDVVIIGSGFAGLAAAIEAHDAGASVKVIEKMEKPGGNSWINGGQVAVAGSALQKKQGIVDSPDLMYKDMLKAGLQLNYPALARAVAEGSNAAVEWAMKRVGVEFKEHINTMGGHSVPRVLQTANGHGSEIVGKQVEALKKGGVMIDFRVQLTGIVRDATGRVVGIEVLEGYEFGQPGSGNVKTIQAVKGVILASGGFSGDIRFRQTQDPELTDSFKTTNHPGANSEGLIAALRIDAAPIQLDQIQLLPLTSPDDEGFGSANGFIAGAGMPLGILIDPNTGERFVSELADRKTQSDAIIACGHPAISITDGPTAAFSLWGLAHSLQSGSVKQFDTLDALALHFKIDPKKLKTTIDTFNGYVTDKKDTQFGKHILKDAKPIAVAPFHAARVWPKVHYIMGGIQMNEHAEVIDLDGAVIPGLHAAGEITGGVHGACRLGGSSIIDCLVFGRIAGKSVSAQASYQAKVA